MTETTDRIERMRAFGPSEPVEDPSREEMTEALSFGFVQPEDVLEPLEKHDE
jgi:hypothetical protein